MFYPLILKICNSWSSTICCWFAFATPQTIQMNWQNKIETYLRTNSISVQYLSISYFCNDSNPWDQKMHFSSHHYNSRHLLLIVEWLYKSVSNSVVNKHNKSIFSHISLHTNSQILKKHWIPWKEKTSNEQKVKLVYSRKTSTLTTQIKNKSVYTHTKESYYIWTFTKSSGFMPQGLHSSKDVCI